MSVMPGAAPIRASSRRRASVGQRREVLAHPDAPGRDDLEQVAQQHRSQVGVELAQAG